MTTNELRYSDVSETKTLAVGGGEWAIEVYHQDGSFIREFVGSNGTHREADDLWSEFEDWRNSLPD